MLLGFCMTSHVLGDCSYSVTELRHTVSMIITHSECLKCSFRLTRGGPYLRGVIGSTVGAYPRGTGSNPVEGNGHFFPSYRQLYLSSFSDTLLPTQRRSLQMLDVPVPQIGVGVLSCMIVSRWS